MTLSSAIRDRRRGVRLALAVLLAFSIAVGAYLVLPSSGSNKIVGYFTSAVGLYPGDQIRIVGVPVGTIDSIEPRADDVKITMSVDRGIKVAADARAIVMSPNLVAARFIQLAPAYTSGPALSDGATIALAHTAVPVEWDEVKESLTDLAKQLSPAAGELQGPLGKAINQAADTFSGNGDSFRTSLRELSQAAGRLGDSRTDIFGTVKNLQVLVDALSKSNEQIVSFAGHVASVSQVLAKSSTHLDNTLGTLNQALIDVKGFLQQNNSTLIGTVNKLTDLTQVLSDQSEDIEQVLHVAGPGIANFYNIYDPAQGTLEWPDIDPGVRQPGAVHLRRFVRHRCRSVRPGLLQARRDLPRAIGPATAPADVQLPTLYVPPAQHDHRVQGPDPIRHTGNPGQVADTHSRPALDSGDRRASAQPDGPAGADGSAGVDQWCGVGLVRPPAGSSTGRSGTRLALAC